MLVNSIPFVVLGGMVLLGGVRTFWRMTVFVTVLGGLGVWLFAGKFTNHLGASGLIFGYLGFVLARGFFEKSLGWILISFATLVLYGGLLFGVLPIRAGVSWQGHLFGLLAGIGAAGLMFPKGRRCCAESTLLPLRQSGFGAAEGCPLLYVPPVTVYPCARRSSVRSFSIWTAWTAAL